MGQVIRIDEFKHEFKKNPSNTNNLAEQYKTIAETLSICEIATIKIGVPWLPPTTESKELNKKFYHPLKSFVRSSLISVQTETLINYCEDLSSLDSADNQCLNIPSLKFHQRFYFCFVVLIVLSLLSTFISLVLGLSFSSAIAISVITAIPASLLAVFPCLEVQRRVSFYILLSKEVYRRRGNDSTGNTGIIAQGT